MGGREHTEVRALTPRKKYVLLPFTLSLFYSLYNTITGRRKEYLGGSLVGKQTKSNYALRDSSWDPLDTP
jgi:hypothetical protein